MDTFGTVVGGQIVGSDCTFDVINPATEGKLAIINIEAIAL
ncbi:MAG: hypothetical protein QGG64_25760 [Candidatus Latescibacteria bacterium]|jgi:hypothetical protein|nr:hypothetical protein [Candidatus Latescibacterota bacterium]